jgi:tetratricopeptide (TPR) repeat protein
LNDVLADSNVRATPDGSALSPEVLARLAETFHRLYRKHFRAEPPSTLKGFGRQRRELQKLELPPAASPALTLVLGALEGEHLVRAHGARWNLMKGPLLSSDKSAVQSTVESPFAYVANPFAAVNDWTAADDPMAALLRRAGGRVIILTNEPASASAVVAELIDPDLARAVELFSQGKAEAAEQTLQGLWKQKRHAHNLHLALEIARLLYENKRLATLRRLLEEQCEHLPRDARTFNYLGLALLETDPRQAPDAFKNALRCDLRFEAAYLNLAQAYQLANDPASARLCLQRYLTLLPHGVYAADARRRLAAVDASGR